MSTRRHARDALSETPWGSRTQAWRLTSGFKPHLVLVEEAAQDRSTPDPATNRLGNR